MTVTLYASTISDFVLSDLKDNAFAFTHPSPLFTLKYLSEMQEVLKSALTILRDEQRLLRGFLDSNWKLIEDCECSGRPSTDHVPKEVVNTKFSVKTDEESLQRPMAC